MNADRNRVTEKPGNPPLKWKAEFLMGSQGKNETRKLIEISNKLKRGNFFAIIRKLVNDLLGGSKAWMSPLSKPFKAAVDVKSKFNITRLNEYVC
jgi:hypothetical protein